MRWTPAMAAGLLAGCASAAPTTAPTPAPGAGLTAMPAPKLPEVPERDGALRIDLVYPPDSAAIATRDSTFVFGSTGSGRATLTINGASVPVTSNGAFVAYLPVPPDGNYRLRAAKDGESVALDRHVTVPGGASATPPPDGRARIIAGSVTPRGPLALRQGELVQVELRGTAGARAWVTLPSGERFPLTDRTAAMAAGDADNFRTDAAATMPSATPQASGYIRYTGVFPATALTAADTSLAKPRLVPAVSARVVRPVPGDSARSFATVELIIGGDTARAPLPLNLVAIEPGRPRVGVAQPPANAPSDWTVRGRNTTSGPFHYFWPPGTMFQITGERSGNYRVRLTDDRSAWIPTGDVRLLAEGTPPPRGLVEGVRFIARPEWIDLRIPVGDRLPFQVETSERTVIVDVFGATSNTNFFQYGSLDPLIERAGWSQPADGVYRVTVELAHPVWGYDPYFDGAGTLVVRIRRPPAIDPDHPLRGLLIAVDPGHPPGGAIGPTRLTEAEANLSVALKLRPMLEAAGARVLMTRTDNRAVDLGDRPRMAADSGAHVLVSLHNNAFPDGVNPFVNNGTSAYYFQPFSVDLAKAMQRALLDELGLRDIGIGRADLALVRATWMPSVLTETSFLMMPRQEAALRDPEVQERIARAHLRALEAFLRARARS